ncbi:glucosamine-6-phosphate deaminase [Alkalicoccus chagannorensis]|uniref:glucosamine-6-phosphate deaminase n=1 Tax=Alkalicoccus chagannorensis TaxID=427072 RepID=UPI00047AD530|nr:glucosamine-6-phosphate deaminase [Alkalicoccus chagannorensis]
MNLIRVPDYEAMSREGASLFYEAIQSRPDICLGLATGGTPVGMYEALIRKLKEEPLDLNGIYTFNLDEYTGLDEEDPNSFFSFMKHHFYEPLQLSRNQSFLPDGTAGDLEGECRRYESLLEDYGVDLQLLGVGENGHIGFNEPGTSFDSVTHIVKLKTSTREANARFFSSMDEVPTHAITMGIGSILKAGRIVLIASGKAKAEAVAQLMYGTEDEAWPITALRRHADVTVIADAAAASLLEEEKEGSHD